MITLNVSLDQARIIEHALCAECQILNSTYNVQRAGQQQPVMLSSLKRQLDHTGYLLSNISKQIDEAENEQALLDIEKGD